MPTENINIETQVQVDITRADLQALITAGTVKKKIYHITDAVGGLLKIGVFSLTTSTTSFNAFNFTQGKFGKYFIVQDIFVPIVEGNGSVVSYNSFAVFPVTGQANTVYIDLSTDDQYYWDGSAYQLLSASTVYEPNLVDFPAIGATDTLYVATDTGVMYLWDGAAYQPLNNSQDIPLAGTLPGSPVTGNIEMVGGNVFFNDGLYYNYFSPDDGGDVGFVNNDLIGLTTVGLRAGSGQSLVASSNYSLFKGIEYANDYSPNFILESLISQRVMKSRIWTKAGTPTTTDDVNEGYVVGSLIWDTTNSIFYRCTSNSVGAATWTYNEIQSETIRAGASIPASTTRWLVPGMSGFGTSVSVNIAEKVIHLGFRVMLGSAQPGTGAITITREFTTPTGTVLQSDVLTIPAGSAVGEYVYSGSTFDARSVSCNVKYTFVNGAPSTSGSVQGIERTWVR